MGMTQSKYGKPSDRFPSILLRWWRGWNLSKAFCLTLLALKDNSSRLMPRVKHSGLTNQRWITAALVG
jgi:hypothetical protein